MRRFHDASDHFHLFQQVFCQNLTLFCLKTRKNMRKVMKCHYLQFNRKLQQSMKAKKYKLSDHESIIPFVIYSPPTAFHLTDKMFFKKQQLFKVYKIHFKSLRCNDVSDSHVSACLKRSVKPDHTVGNSRS